jgi:hypothetical protein
MLKCVPIETEARPLAVPGYYLATADIVDYRGTGTLDGCEIRLEWSRPHERFIGPGTATVLTRVPIEWLDKAYAEATLCRFRYEEFASC